MSISDITKQNGHASVGTLFREVLGEMVFPYYGNVYKFEKRAKMRHIVYNAILFVSEFNIFSLHSLLECILVCHGTCTTSYLYCLLVPRVQKLQTTFISNLYAKVSEANALTRPFSQL